MSRLPSFLVTGVLLTLAGVAVLIVKQPATPPEPGASLPWEVVAGAANPSELERDLAGDASRGVGPGSSGQGSRDALPEAMAPLAYAQAWNGPLPPSMAAFRSWMYDYIGAESVFDQAILELEGVALARRRQEEMRALIESDPELALAVTVPARLRTLLPASVQELLEERVSGRGDYEILMAVQPLGSRRPEEEIRRVTIEGRSFSAFAYGRRATQTSQEGASLHGIAIDGRMAVHESPIRVLEPGESVPNGLPAGPCAVTGTLLAALAPQAEANLGRTTVVEVDGSRWQLASEALVDRLEADLVAAEDQAGPSVPAVMAGEPVLPLPPTSWTTGAKSLLIIRVDFSDKPGDPVTYQTALDLMNNSVSPYYDTSSFGTTSINTTVTASTYRMPQTAEAYATGDLTSQLYTDATTAASADYTVSNFQHVMIVFARLNSISGSKFTWAGLGSVGGGRTWINGYYDFRVTAHELGHNYGLYHANLWQVADGNPASASGSSTEYADPFDVMGGGSTDSRHHFNPWFKNRMGWLPDSSVRPVTTSGTYRITRFDAKAAPLDQNLALNVFCDGQRTYWLGYRQNFTSNASLSSGAYIVWGFGSNVQSQLLDMTTPGSSANDAGLAMGVTFQDAARGVSIRPVAKGGSAPAEYLDVEITLAQPSSPFVVAWGSSQAASIPAGLNAVRRVAVGAQHALALKTDGTVTAWGSNSVGQTSVPGGLANVVAIAARGQVSGAVRSDGTVVVWGDSANGLPNVPASLTGVTGLSIGGDHALALTGAGTVVAWGNNAQGECTLPVGLSGVVAVAAGNNTSYAVLSDGTVRRWGASQGTIPAGLSGVVAVAAGTAHALALRNDGTVAAWGDNSYGQASVPAGLTGVTAVAASAYHSIALLEDGTCVTWGFSGLTNAVPPALSRVSAVAANDSCNVVVIGASVLASPSFTAHPQNVSTTSGQSAQFSVTASGSGVLSYQWQRRAAGGAVWADLANGATYSGATSATLTLGSVTDAMHGDQFRCVASYDGTFPVTSDAATLSVVVPPSVDTPPVSSSGTAGGSLTLSVGASGSGTLTYQWRLNGVDIAGATSATYTILSLQAFHAGTYSVVVTSGGVSTTSAGATVTVNPAPASTARVMNLSTRGLALTGSNVLIPGFVIEGSGTKRLLIRAVGPTLAAFGVPGTVADPQLSLKRFDTSTSAYVDYLYNDNWGSNANAGEISTTTSAVSAFALSSGSADAALLVDLPPGRYTVVANGSGASDTGVAMVELYDADGAAGSGQPSTARMVNISTRGYVGTGGEIMIPGFVVSSEGSRTFLIRAVGPRLASLGVAGVLPDPQLALYKRRPGTAADDLVLQNDDWSNVAGSATTASVATQVGAFSLSAGSKDAAFVVTLSPGSYTVHASGVGGVTGVALVEVYLVP